MARSPPALSRLPLLALATLLPLLGACSDPEEAGCSRDMQAGFESRAPFDARARVRRVDCAFRGNVEGLALGPDGSAWLRRLEYKDRGDETFFTPPDKLLTRVGPGGELLGELPLPEYVRELVVHPSGELTAVGWDQSMESGTLQVRRFRPDGALITERIIRHSVPPGERLSYRANANGAVARLEPTGEEGTVGILDARAHGEDVFLLVGMDGIRLMRLDGALEVRWMSAVAPGVALLAANEAQMRALGLPFLGFLLDVDAAGRAQVALPFPAFHRRAYVDSFPQPPEGPEGRGILLTRFEPTGERAGVRTVPTEHARVLTGLVADGESFAIGARAATPVEQPGKSLAEDVFFASGRWDGAADAPVVRTLSLDQDDAPLALLPCGAGLYCLAGHTSFEVTDRGRTNEYGEGFILAVDARGEQQHLLRLQGERDTEVLHAVPGPGGSVVFAFATNQPANLARVGDAFKYNETWLGVFSPF